jgi:glycosyltransferase involved in cell wall biosynthesis
VKTGNVTKGSNLIEKGVSQVLLEYLFIHGIKKYFNDVKFDLILYSTPPITFCKVIEYIKKRDGAKSYLLLKDIFPQNAVDLGMLSKSGVKGVLYRHFRKVEKELYRISDHIGCMSEANVRYVLKHNPEISPEKVEVCPNSIEVIDKSVEESTRKEIRAKYGIPLDKRVFVYGGNLGKPQGVPFIIECLKEVKNLEDAYFVIVGDGTEYWRIEEYYKETNQSNFKLIKKLPKEEYDYFVGACDIGLIFLDHRFTIPNFPSRLLSYMQAKLPVLACTDPNTDVGKVIVDNGIGWWCESNDVINFKRLLKIILNTNTSNKKITSYQYLTNNYDRNNSYSTILKNVK